MNIDYFINSYNIQPADAIIVKKEKFGILDHYVIYLGLDAYGEHKFIANYTKGIKFLPYWEILNFLKNYIPVRVNRFIGNHFQRQLAVQRALNRLNETAYNLILNNCEHFANWVQNGVSKSGQVEGMGGTLAVLGAGMSIFGIATDNNKATGIGLLLAALGTIAIGLSEQDSLRQQSLPPNSSTTY